VLWRSPDFLKFWAGQSVSLVGSQFTLLALPLLAVLTLHANALQMGLLGAAQWLPSLLLGLVAGVWVDRSRRRPVLVSSQVLSLVALASLPLAARLGVLSIGQVYVASFLAGVAAVFSRVAQQAFVPALAGRENLVEANSKYQTSLTFAQLVGPGAAGAVVQAFGAAAAIAIDAISFLVGAVTAAWIRTPEPPPPRPVDRRLLAEALEGVSVTWRDLRLRSILLAILFANFFGGVGQAVFALLFVGRLGVTPAQLGVVFASASLASLAGAQLAPRLSGRIGVGNLMALAAILFSVAWTVPLAAAFAPRPLVFPTLVAGFLMVGLGLMAYNVNQQAIRMAVVPDHLLGRTSAAVIVIVAVGQVAGPLLGGLIGQQLGLRWAYAVGTLGYLLIIPTAFVPQLRRVRTLASGGPV
jgi:MFS family permease